MTKYSLKNLFTKQSSSQKSSSQKSSSQKSSSQKSSSQKTGSKYGMNMLKNSIFKRKTQKNIPSLLSLEKIKQSQNSKKWFTTRLLNRKTNKKYLLTDSMKNPLNDSVSNEREDKSISMSKKVRAANTVRKFMLNTSSKRKAFFLNSVCSDSGVCIVFGKENEKIKKLFDGFTSFDHVEPPIKRVGAVSSNGFVNEIKYSRYNYDAYAILKSSTDPSSDNLMYEYIVGQYVNKLNKIYPCFLETYGLFLYKNPDKWSHVKNNKIVTTNVLKESIQLITPTYDIGCEKSKYLAILIQHIKNATSLESKLDDSDFIYEDLMYILFQVYIPLTASMRTFTHYDLHVNNVLLYEPEKGKYIQYYYHFVDGSVTEFKSLYIAKIIDYGRSYFNDGKTNSKEVYENVCQTKECEPDCGKNVGFGWLDSPYYPGKNHYVISQKSNVSHDLRLANSIYKYIYSNGILADNNLIKIILELIVYDTDFGTKEINFSGKQYGEIHNIEDLSIILNNYVKGQQQYNNADYAKYTKMGDLHVYLDGSRPMEFIKA